MYKLITRFIALFALSFALIGCGDNSIPQEGVKYKVVPTATPNAANVVEVFSLGCGHCRNMEMMLPDIKQLADVEIDQVHVTFNESAQIAAYIYYTAAIQMDGKPSAEMKEAMFAYVQDSPQDMTDEERQAKLGEIFGEFGLVSPFEINDEQKQAVYEQLQAANELVVNAVVNSVPAFLVQGKYLVENSAHESLEDLANTIQYLSKLEQ
ncbi:peptide permease [Photobacterium sanctipauli]|uniref:Peptide permease n=1 Tax=Photobacterium sanctipauli TaxID=1342794 RepID=A0A2T3NZ23_9GAMM|nr:thioredoxin domain-containing protein [Photobacterium sanctipauli]PSW21521.1 peptide permease [Photobacterium sanctipauli]